MPGQVPVLCYVILNFSASCLRHLHLLPVFSFPYHHPHCHPRSSYSCRPCRSIRFANLQRKQEPFGQRSSLNRNILNLQFGSRIGSTKLIQLLLSLIYVTPPHIKWTLSNQLNSCSNSVIKRKRRRRINSISQKRCLTMCLMLHKEGWRDDVILDRPLPKPKHV